jgi:hypothetical protein
MPKKSVMKPRAAGAIRGPRTSPQVAAMIAGILQAVRPNRIAETVKPVGADHRANKLKETACIK